MLAAVRLGPWPTSLPRVAAAVAAYHAAPRTTALRPSASAAASGARLWLSRYKGRSRTSDDIGQSVAVSPDGRRAFVTGYSGAGTSRFNYATVAYRTSTGARLWVRRYTGPGTHADRAYSVAVSPGGKRVFVTGESGRSHGSSDYATVAYRASTGARLWVKRYNGLGNSPDSATSVAVSPGGGKVFVTGDSLGAGSGFDYATVAYRAATGARLWVKRYNGPQNGKDVTRSLAVSPDGTKVFVTGRSQTSDPESYAYATIAYSTSAGAELWVRRYDGPITGHDSASSVAVSPNGAQVFVTGVSEAASSGFDYATIAYRAATGATLWVARYSSPGNRRDDAESVAVSPSGAEVFVTGDSEAASSGVDYATVAYSTATGAQLWVRRYNGPGNNADYVRSMVVGPAGKRVFVTGESRGAGSGFDYATVAYRAATGARLWTQRYNGPGNGEDAALSVATSPGGGRVFVTGESDGRAGAGVDYATLAYRS